MNDFCRLAADYFQSDLFQKKTFKNTITFFGSRIPTHIVGSDRKPNYFQMLSTNAIIASRQVVKQVNGLPFDKADLV